MRCPNCSSQDLRPVMTRQGLEVDYCDACKGVWLDRGEIYLFSREPEVIARRLSEAGRDSCPSSKCSPKNGAPMTELTYPGGAKLYACGDGGLWLDAGDMRQLIDSEKNLEFNLDSSQAKAETPAPFRAFGASVLMELPNLFLRSTLTLVGLYFILGLVLITLVELRFLGAGSALILGVAVALVQFLLGPWMMDFSLDLMYSIKWTTPDQLPAHLKEFVDKISRDRGIPFPRFGIIDDGAPQAFTYGHTPKNARIVISRGILELLGSDEVNAVVAHEIGHAVHWDMFLMTVVQLVPLILYYIYSTLSRIKSNSKKGGYTVLVALVSYLLYIISQYVVLAFSRTREYHADRFSGEVTGDPSLLASALVKIAYGLAGREKPKEAEEEKESRSPRLKAVSAMGIFDNSSALSLAATSYQTGAQSVPQTNIKAAMRWDRWNPWARGYELNSTHPLVANRLIYLSNQSVSVDKAPYIEFDAARPESYWDEFFVDLLVYSAPLLLPVAVLLAYGASYLNLAVVTSALHGPGLLQPLLLTALGVGLMLRYYFTYRGGSFPEMSVAALLRHVKVSDVRPVPCTLRGRIIGRGVPGYILSEDFVMQDESGIIFLDLRQPLGIWEALFAIIKAGAFQGKEVVAKGWYRRAPVPYVELKTISRTGGEEKSMIPGLKKAFAYLVSIISLVWIFNTIF